MVLFAAAAAAPVALIIWVFRAHRSVSLVRRIISSVALALSALVLFGGLGVALFLRDGLGPDAETSAGVEAIAREFPESLASVVIAVPIGALGLLALRSGPTSFTDSHSDR
jgi:hypothetical protein